MRRRLTAGLVAVLLAAMALPAQAAEVEVTVAGTAFSPARITRPTGTTVTWRKSSGFHNVSSTQGMFRSGDPNAASFTFSREFSAGSYPYVCEVHAPGMSGTVRIRPKVRAKPAGAPFTVRWATRATNTGSEFTVQYRVEGGKWRAWRKSTSRLSAVFGRNGRPVTVRPGTTYRFRVKSRLGDAASSFSPRKSHTP